MKIKEKYPINEQLEKSEVFKSKDNISIYPDEIKILEKEKIEEISSKLEYKKRNKSINGISKIITYAAASISALVVLIAAVPTKDVTVESKYATWSTINYELELIPSDNPNFTISLYNDYYKTEVDIKNFPQEMDSPPLENEDSTIYFYYNEEERFFISAFFSNLKEDTAYTFKIVDNSKLGGTTIFKDKYRTNKFGPDRIEVESNYLSFEFNLRLNDKFKLKVVLDNGYFRDVIEIDESISSTYIQSELGHASIYNDLESLSMYYLSLNYNNIEEDTKYTLYLEVDDELIYQKEVMTDKSISVEFENDNNDSNILYYMITMSDYQNRYSNYKVVIISLDTYIEYELEITDNISEKQKFNIDDYPYGNYLFELICDVTYENSYEITTYETIIFEQQILLNQEE